MALVLNVGDASKIPPHDLRLYAPCDFKPLCNIKFPFPVRETAYSTHFTNIILAVNQRQPSYTEIGNMATIELVALIMNVLAPVLPQVTRGLVSSVCFLLLHRMKQTHNKVRRYAQATKIRRHSCENTPAARMRQARQLRRNSTKI